MKFILYIRKPKKLVEEQLSASILYLEEDEHRKKPNEKRRIEFYIVWWWYMCHWPHAIPGDYFLRSTTKNTLFFGNINLDGIFKKFAVHVETCAVDANVH